MDMIDQIKMVKQVVEKYYDENASSLIPQSLGFGEQERNHVIQIGTSILCTKWGIGYSGGGFVEAVVENNLSRAVSNADRVNQFALRFYCVMMYNVGMPAELV